MNNKFRYYILGGLIFSVLIFAFIILPAIAQEAESSGIDYRRFPLVGSRVAIWIIAQLHLLFAAFVLGVPIFAVICEFIGVRTRNAKFDKLAKEFTKLLMLAFSVTAIFGAILIVLLIGLYPKITQYLVGIFSPTFYVYVFLFFGESFSLYLYYYTWNTLKDKKWLHLTLGISLNFFGTVLMFIANAWVTFMMSPGGIDMESGVLLNLKNAIANPLWMPLNIHRLVANVAFGGSIAAAYAAFRFLNSKTKEEKAHYDWMGYIGNFIAICALIVLPFIGYLLAKEMYEYSAQMGTTLMGGAFSWLFIIQAMLIGILFIGINYYIWLGLSRIPGGKRYMKYIISVETLLFLCQAIWMTPHSLVASLAEARKMGGAFHPLLGVFGVMSAKNTVVNIVILITFLSFLLYRRANKVGAVGSWAREGKTALPLGLLSLIILASIFYGLNIYIILLIAISVVFSLLLIRYGSRLEERSSWPKWGKIVQTIIFVIAACVVIFYGVYGYYVPANVRIGFSVHQVFAVLACIVMVVIIDIYLFMRAKIIGAIQWGKIPARSQYVLFLLAITFVLLMGLMGFARSGIRLNYHVDGLEMMKDTSIDAFTPTLGYAAQIISVVTLIFFCLVAFIFWLGHLGEKRSTQSSAQNAESQNPVKVKPDMVNTKGPPDT